MATLIGPHAGAGAVDEQSDEWWSTSEGERVKLKCAVLFIAFLLSRLHLPVHLFVAAYRHNTINVDRIHLKIAESNVVKRLLELVFDDTPHVSEYAVAGECETTVAFCTFRSRTARANSTRFQLPTERASSLCIALAVITFMVGQDGARS
jgi:hypothetical protein